MTEEQKPTPQEVPQSSEEKVQKEKKKKEKKEKPDVPKEKPQPKPKPVFVNEIELDNELRKKMMELVVSARSQFQYTVPRRLIQDMLERARVGELPDAEQLIEVGGWVRSVREQSKKLAFMHVNDGSGPIPLQVVLYVDNFAQPEMMAAALKSACNGISLKVRGNIVKSTAKGQLIEMVAREFEFFGAVDEKFPIAKAGLPLDFLRAQQHLRIRTNVIASVMRIRNTCSFAVHKFFQERSFQYVHTPIITSNDCEGAGECFHVTNMLEEKGGLVALKKDLKKFTDDFFGKPAMLTVSGQLNVETYCAGLANVYTFGPTFRAEESHTNRHLAEFWMIEPEVWFAELKDLMALAEDFLKYVIAYLLEHQQEDLIYLDKYHKRVAEEKGDDDTEEQRIERNEAKSRQAQGGLIERLFHIVKEPFVRLTYTDAIAMLKKAHDEGAAFKKVPEWGIDLGSEHERYLCEEILKKPVIVYEYPADIKAFYMKQSEDGKTVQAMDILVPYIAEIIGGSQREDNLEKLEAMMKKKNIPIEGLQWYNDLRRYGSAPHAGFGLGFERLLLLVTGMHNIRDVIPFPRTAGLAMH